MRAGNCCYVKYELTFVMRGNSANANVIIMAFFVVRLYRLPSATGEFDLEDKIMLGLKRNNVESRNVTINQT